MNYEKLEKELKKRLKFEYCWGRKQNDEFDYLTNFIYKISSFKLLLEKIDANLKSNPQFSDLKNYALNRWFNYWSATAVEQLFCTHKNVKPYFNSKDKFIDFYVNNIPFDHKTTVFPKGFGKSVPYAIEHKRELITWLYANQSKQKRAHFKNRLFVVLINSRNSDEHWKLKSEILWLQKIVSTYLSTFDAQKLECFYIQNSVVKSDIIWAIK